MDIQERLTIFYARLQAAAPANNAEEAFRLICRTLEQVEDEFCPLPKKNPPPRTFDGRMYLPQGDNIRNREDGSLSVRTRKHRIRIMPNGDFVIYRKGEKQEWTEEFRKAKSSQ